jgi:NAD(P)-dependent dehydrogenase (short-subunit alcohol dehydrogenase family)
MNAKNISSFSEKVVLVTDGASSIGRAVALQLALQGAYVVVGYAKITDSELGSLNELKSIGTLADAIEADCRDHGGVMKLINGVETKYGRLDMLVNIVKFPPRSSFFDITPQMWREEIDNVLSGSFFVIKESLRLISLRPRGAIVNVVVKRNSDDDVLSGTLSHAILGLTKSVVKAAPKSINLNCLLVNESGAEGRRDTENEGQFDSPPKVTIAKDAAKTVVHLLSSEAKALNGQVLEVFG